VNSDDVSEFICTKSVSLYGVLKIHPLVPLHLKVSISLHAADANRKRHPSEHDEAETTD